MLIKIKKLFALIKQFGVIFSTKYCFYKYTKNNKKYIDLVCSYLKEFEQPILNKYSSLSSVESGIQKKDKIPVWVCWFQGEDNMPELCEICYKRLRTMLPDNTKLYFVTLENYSEYVNIPNYIMDKVKAGKITYTHLSDILRWALLAKWGGLWIDSTVFCSKKIDADFMQNSEFWSVKLDQVYDSSCLGQVISNCNWSGFILKDQSDSLLVRFVLDATLYYWKKHDIIIDYFIENLLIKVACENINKIKKTVDAIELNNKNIYELHTIMDQEFNQEHFNSMIENTTFFKLTWKQNYSKITKEGKETYYGYISKLVKGIKL